MSKSAKPKKFEIQYYDTNHNQIASINESDFNEQMENVRKAMEVIHSKMSQVGKYQLTTITATVGVEAGVWVFSKVSGSIELKWEHHQP